MTIDIETLFVDSNDGAERVAITITHKDVVTGWSAALAPQAVAVLHMLYPRTDARTHASRDALVDALNRHCMHQAARLIAEQSHYLLFRNPVKALRVLHAIRNDSLAIGAHVYYKGLEGVAAEQMLEDDGQQMRRR
jgi:hypothetical protein